MKNKKTVILLLIILSLFLSASFIGCDIKEVNNNSIKNESVNCGSEDNESIDDKEENQVTSKPPK